MAVLKNVIHFWTYIHNWKIKRIELDSVECLLLICKIIVQTYL
jgi:hypothetical protein